MPYKFTEGRRHKFPKARYRVTNWPDYDAALVRRGSLIVWKERWANAGPFGRTVLSVDEALAFIASEDIFWAAR